MAKNILILDDEKEITNSLKEILEDEGFMVVTASNNSDVKLKVTNQKFDLFIADYHLMHDQNSESSIEYFYENNKVGRTKTKIILISGAIDKYILTTLQAKVSAIIVKPVDSDILIKNIHRLLK